MCIHIHELFMKCLSLYKVVFGLCFNEDLYTAFYWIYEIIHIYTPDLFLGTFLWNFILDYIYIFIYTDEKLSAYEMEYSSLTLRSLQQLSRVNHELHNINVATRSWIIGLGIRCQPRPYQCSCAGTLFLAGFIHLPHKAIGDTLTHK